MNASLRGRFQRGNKPQILHITLSDVFAIYIVDKRKHTYLGNIVKNANKSTVGDLKNPLSWQDKQTIWKS